MAAETDFVAGGGRGLDGRGRGRWRRRPSADEVVTIGRNVEKRRGVRTVKEGRGAGRAGTINGRLRGGTVEEGRPRERRSRATGRARRDRSIKPRERIC